MTISATYNVTGMTCGHCANAIREEVAEIAGVDGVEVSHETGILTVTSAAPLALADVEAAATEAGDYHVTPA